MARQVLVDHESSVGAAGREVRDLALELKFPTLAAEELCLVARELASNVVRHGGGAGEMVLAPIAAEEEGAGIEIVALDRGPGIPDPERALTDGYSTAGSLGTGLGAANRLCDSLEIEARHDGGQGTRVVCRRWLRTPAPRQALGPLDVGASTRPYPMCRSNGDAFLFRTEGEESLAGVMDGVGHGRHAERAALAAREYVGRHAGRPLQEIFRGVGRACRGTRGVVMALARVRWGAGTMSFASVGNIEARLHTGRESGRFVVRRGILGVRAPHPVVTRHPWTAQELLVLHSDGLSARWHWDEHLDLWGRSSSAIERRRAEKVLAKQLKELERSNDELTRFAYVVSHDLQEPLRSIGGFAKLLATRYGGKLDDRAEKYITYMVDGVDRMSRLISDLLSYSRVGTGERVFEPVDTGEIVSKVMDNLQAALEQSRGQVIPIDLPSVMGDGPQLMQLLQNLVGNALKFRGDQPPRVVIKAEVQGDRWRFDVADNGIGIPPEKQSEVFQIFRRLHSKDEYPGTGIGLAVCKKIVERHGGEIWVAAEESRGTTFCFTLPRAIISGK